jgi:hypothetical protein
VQIAKGVKEEGSDRGALKCLLPKHRLNIMFKNLWFMLLNRYKGITKPKVANRLYHFMKFSSVLMYLKKNTNATMLIAKCKPIATARQIRPE